MTTPTLIDLREQWLDQLWAELWKAHARAHVDANHDIERDFNVFDKDRALMLWKLHNNH